MTELVHLDVSDKIATITLDSHHNRNALSRQLVSELSARLADAETDDAATVIVLKSAHRVFCSGADLSEAASTSMEDSATTLVALQRAIATSEKPVVVVLAGPVRAGGLGLVGAADFVIAAESVTFALTEVRLAVAPAVISLSLLERLSPRAASDTFLSGRSFDAAEAVTMGLVTRAVPDEDLDSAVAGLLDDLVQAHPQGLRESKLLLNRDLVARIDEQGSDVAALSARLFGSDDAREAMRAFLDRSKR